MQIEVIAEITGLSVCEVKLLQGKSSRRSFPSVYFL